jgi:hypothetical protein
MNKKDFYVDTHFLCGFESPENIFDLSDNIFDCGDFISYEHAIKNLIKNKSVNMYLWPWQWDTSKCTDEVYIYKMASDQILYYSNDTKEFYDAKLVRIEETLQGCEVFDINFQFPKMLNFSKGGK